MKAAYLALAAAIATLLALPSSAFASQGRQRVTVHCTDLVSGRATVPYELDSTTSPAHTDDLIGMRSMDPSTHRPSQVRLSVDIVDASDYSSQINFRVQLSSLSEQVVGDSVFEHYAPLQFAMFNVSKQEATGGKAWSREFRDADYAIECHGKAYFAAQGTFIGLDNGRAQPLIGLDGTRVTVGAQYLPGGAKLCGAVIRSTEADVEAQKRALFWVRIIGGGDNNYGIVFAAESGQLHLLKGNIESDAGTPFLKVNFQDIDTYLTIESATLRADDTKPSLKDAMVGPTDAPIDLTKLTIEPVGCVE